MTGDWLAGVAPAACTAASVRARILSPPGTRTRFGGAENAHGSFTRRKMPSEAGGVADARRSYVGSGSGKNALCRRLALT